MGRGKLYCLVGLPRSGKSTWANRWVRHPELIEDDSAPPQKSLPPYYGSCPHLAVNRPRAIVSGDDFRTALYGQEYNLNGEASVFAAMDVAIRALLGRGHDVLVDETCTTEATLERYLRLDMDFVPVFIDTPVEVCVERAIKTGKDYLIQPIKNMAEQLADLRPRWGETRERLTQKLLKRYPRSFQK